MIMRKDNDSQMTFIETWWEKENLNIDSGKLLIEDSDTVDHVVEELQGINKEYLEADVGANCFEIISMLEMQGFHFVETAIELKGNLSEIHIPRAGNRFVECVSYIQSTEEELSVIEELIASGEMFQTDKISLNPLFGKKKAGIRYRKWTESLLAQGARCFSIKYRESLIGFEICTCKNGQAELFLGGRFPNTGVGAGMMTATASYDFWRRQEIQCIITRVSSNNLPVLKLHEMFGMRVNNLRYILVNDQELKGRLQKEDL